ncbi:MAG: hypothetical protein ACRDQ7_06035 [Haloechinothrix sp.]
MAGDVFGQLLAEARIRPEELARQLNDIAELHGRSERLHPKTPYKWRRGTVPGDPWPSLAAALLAERLQRALTPADLGWPDDDAGLAPASEGLVLPWTVAGGLRAVRAVSDPESMRRRNFLTLLGTALTAPAHEWLIARLASGAGSTVGRRLSGDVIEQLNSVTAALRRMDDHLGGGQTLGLVRHHLHVVVELLRDRSYTDTVGKQLHGVAGELLRLAGWLSFDDGHHAQAQRYWIAALHEAHSAGDRALGANVLAFMSCQAKDLGEFRQAVTLAHTAHAGYPGNSPKVAAIIQLRAAEAHANERAATDTRRAIDAAFDRLADPAPEAGNPEWTYWMTEAQAHAQAGYCYVRLADWPRARTHLRSALRLQGGEYTREGALRNTLLATTYVRQDQPDLDKALTLGRRAVTTLTGEVTSARCAKHVRTLVQHLAPYRRNLDVRQFCDDEARALA